jgi:hypothetical protein
MQISTSTCAKHGHPEIVINFDEALVPERWVSDIISFLESRVAEGTQFEADQTFQLGWVVTKFLANGKGELVLCEPDFQTMPINWLPELSKAFTDEFEQNMVADSLGLGELVESPSCLQPALYCSQFSDGPDFYMSRMEVPPDDQVDSGWFLGCVDWDNHDHNADGNILKASLYELVTINPRIVPFLGLPQGASIGYGESPDDLYATYRDEELQVKVGSFLESYLYRRALQSQAESITPIMVHCQICNQEHNIANIDVAYGLPDAVLQMTDAERSQRCKFTADLGSIDDSQFFIRCVIHLQIVGQSVPFGIGVWVEVVQQDFQKYIDFWDDSSQADEPPFNGRLANAIRGSSPTTLGAHVAVQMTATGRPEVDITDSEQELYKEQQNGISLHRVLEMLHACHAV